MRNCLLKLPAVAAGLVIAITAIGYYFGHRQQPPAIRAFIEPSQTVRW